MKTTTMTQVRIPTIEFNEGDARPAGSASVAEIHVTHNYHTNFAHVGLFAPELIRVNGAVYIAGAIVDNVLGSGSARDERGAVAYARRGRGRGRTYVRLTEALVLSFANAADRTDGHSQPSTIRANEVRHFATALIDLL